MCIRDSGYSTYTDGVKVTVKGTSIINGNVELSKSTGNTEPMELNIEGDVYKRQGHESIETTRIYLRRTASEQQKIVDKVVNW